MRFLRVTRQQFFFVCFRSIENFMLSRSIKLGNILGLACVAIPKTRRELIHLVPMRVQKQKKINEESHILNTVFRRYVLPLESFLFGADVFFSLHLASIHRFLIQAK